MKTKTALLTAFLSLALLPALAVAEARSEINIDSNGKIVAKNIKVTNISEPGKSKFFYARATWDNVFIRMTILTNEWTDISKKYGEKVSVFDIKEGDLIDVEGTMPSSADSLNIQATKLVDLSLQKETLETSGKVTAIATSSPGFTLLSKKGNIVKVNINDSTYIRKGARVITGADINVGDSILSLKGIYDYQFSTIEALSMEVYQNKTIFAARNFAGVIKNISGAELPATLTVTAEGKDYTVYLPLKTEVLNKTRGKIGLSRFMVGDNIRLYGSIRSTDLSAIDAEVVRNMNF